MFWVVLLASLGAYRQFSADYTWHTPYAAGSVSWWVHPVEWHVDAGLPDIAGNIRTVEVIWKNLTHYRRAYLRLCSDIDTSADDARPGSSPAFVRT